MNSPHVVVVVGGAISGAEAAACLAVAGIQVVVLEQNARPYGKIEDGLPRWHHKQRLAEFERIGKKLASLGVHFVPCTKLGRDLSLDDLLRAWRVSAVLLATGAQRDRPLTLEGIHQVEGKGLVYQSQLVRWFNRYPEATYAGPKLELPDDAVVLGGGLASLDVVKILMLETVGRELARRGHPVDVCEMEHRGIAATLEPLGLTLSDLGLRGCSLHTWRGIEDMPLVPYKDNALEEDRQKTEEFRKRMAARMQAKYLFRIEPFQTATGFTAEDGVLTGLRFVRNQVVGDRVEPVAGSETLRPTRLVVSSIGSIPEPLQGVPLKGELYSFDELGTARIAGYANVFGVGNVVTGRGNIVVSRQHGSQVAEKVARDYMGLGEELDLKSETLLVTAESRAHMQVRQVAEAIQQMPLLAPEQVEHILARVRKLQAQVGYDGDLAAWCARATPPKME